MIKLYFNFFKFLLWKGINFFSFSVFRFPSSLARHYIHCLCQYIKTIQELYHKKRKDYSRSQELSKTRIKKERTIDIKARELQIIKKD